MIMKNMLRRVYDFYADGFRAMTVGRGLWLLIAIKLVVIFLIIRLFLMPDALADYDGDEARAQAVRTALTSPGTGGEDRASR